MSQELTLLQSHLRLLGWSWYEAFVDAVLTVIVVFFVIFSESEILSTSFDFLSSLFLSQIQSWIVAVSSLFSTSEAASTSALLVFWSMVGSVLYLLIWVIRRAFYDVEDSYLQVFRDVHPNTYNRGRQLLYILEHKALFVTYSIFMLVYGFMWASRVLEPILERSIEIVDVSLDEWYLLPLFLVVLLVSFHIFVVLWRLLKGRQYVHFI